MLDKKREKYGKLFGSYTVIIDVIIPYFPSDVLESFASEKSDNNHAIRRYFIF